MLTASPAGSRQLDLVRVGIDIQSFSQVVNACLLPTSGIVSKIEQCMLTIENDIFPLKFESRLRLKTLQRFAMSFCWCCASDTTVSALHNPTGEILEAGMIRSNSSGAEKLARSDSRGAEKLARSLGHASMSLSADIVKSRMTKIPVSKLIAFKTKANSGLLTKEAFAWLLI